jgi:hypothetical protein
MDYIEAIESALGITAVKEYLPMQAGDVPATAANTAALEAWTGFKPNTPVKDAWSALFTMRGLLCLLLPTVLWRLKMGNELSIS